MCIFYCLFNAFTVYLMNCEWSGSALAHGYWCRLWDCIFLLVPLCLLNVFSYRDKSFRRHIISKSLLFRRKKRSIRLNARWVVVKRVWRPSSNGGISCEAGFSSHLSHVWHPWWPSWSSNDGKWEFANQRIYFSELRLRVWYKCYVGNQLKC